ncbi:MAG: hypothetical protein O7D96_11420 [SAR324 cluster bacterium]|nr:hypothetical protein [SAR324 cluster bacterium]
MANLVKLYGDKAELPHLSLRYPVAPPEGALLRALEAYRDLKLDFRAQSRPLGQRREVTRFLRQFGTLLHRTLFPGDTALRLAAGRPLLLATDRRWGAYPWELLHDGERWLALQQGVVRWYPEAGPEARQASAARGAPRILAVTAQPLPRTPGEWLTTRYEALGSRFVSVVADALDTPYGGKRDPAGRVLEHAGLAEFEENLGEPWDILLWSGYASGEEWLFETPSLDAESAPAARIAEGLRRAVGQGLSVLVLNDSLGLTDSGAATEQAGRWLGTGLPWLIRVEGLEARIREQDYLRTLARHMGQGLSPFESHLSAVRRLHRRFEEGWDWSYFRLHAGRQAPTIGAAPARPTRAPEVPRPLGHPAFRLRRGAPSGRGAPPAPPSAAPPVFRPRRRVFARHEELRALARGLVPPQQPSSPFVFLTGGPGSGKTVLAIDIANRLHRQFDEVIYLNGRGVLPETVAPADTIATPGTGLGGAGRLLEALAGYLGPDPAEDGGGAPAPWPPALKERLEDGRRRLIVLDGLDGSPGYDELLPLLQGLPPACRVLLASRSRAPLLPGFRVDLEPLEPAALAEIYGEELEHRLQAHPLGDRLMAICRSDLLLARLLRRLPHWPGSGDVAAAIDGDDGGGVGASRTTPALLELIAAQALEALSDPPRRVLAALLSLTGMVHRETLARTAGIEGRPLQQALTELQWFGLTDAHGGERYYSLHRRLQRALGARVVTRAVYQELAPRLVAAYRSYLAGVGEALSRAPRSSAWYAGERALAWRATWRDRRNGAEPGDLHRLGVERINLAELGTMLAEESDLAGLTRIVDEARPLAELPWLAELSTSLGANLLAVGRRHGDEVAQARALNRIGAASLATGDAQGAVPPLVRALERISHHRGWDTLSETYLLLSRCYQQLDRLDPAENLLNSAIELGYQLGDGNLLVAALDSLALIWRRRSTHQEQAGQVLPRAVAFLESRQQRHQAARVRRLLADCRAEERDPEETEEDYRETVRAFLDAGDRREAGLTRLSLAECLLRGARPGLALREVREAEALLDDAGAPEPERQGRTLGLIAQWHEAHGRPEEALEGYLRLRSLWERVGDREGVIGVLDSLGGLYFQLGQQEQSTRCYEERLLLQAEAPHR